MRKQLGLAMTTVSSTTSSGISVAESALSVPCTFCARGAITEPQKPFAIPGFEFIDTCSTIDQIVPDMLTEHDPECSELQALSTYCGCPPPADSCMMCPDGSPVALPDQEMPWLSQAFDGIVPTCALVEAYAASLTVDDEMCAIFQGISTHCGCAALPNHCTYCQGEDLKEEFYEVELPFLSNQEHGFVGTCEAYYLTQFQLPAEDPACEGSDFVTIHCGCNEGVLNYYGTSTTKEHETLSWIVRVSGVVSLVASLCILYDIASAKRNKKANVYHCLVLLIAVFDIITSIVFIVGPSVVLRNKDTTGLPIGIYGAQGTSMTPCTIFGFLFHLGKKDSHQLETLAPNRKLTNNLNIGFTSVFLNVSLSIYFLMVIALGMRDASMHRYRLYLLAPPLVVGIGLSFAAIPFIGASFSNCQVYTFPLSLYSWRLLVFFVVPIAAATIAILVLLVIIYCRVHLQSRRCPSNVVSATPSLERQVFWQCFTYSAAFGVTWPIFIVAQYQGAKMAYPYAFWIFASVLVPMQGFNNALCYFRPRLVAWRHKQAQSVEGSKSGSPLPAGSNENSDPIVELTNMAERQGSTGNNDSISSEEEMDDGELNSSISSDY